MKRRTFLQSFGSILAVLGVTPVEWLTIGNHYYQALADSSKRKIALLVGINKYQNNSALTGSLTDVELQRELLIHRFGFQPSDILSVTDEKATREFIENAFLEYLVKVARPGDLVVFHFSGYGSRVQSGSPETVRNALVPADGDKNLTQENKIVNYLLAETLLLMLRSLATDRVVSVLDTSFYAPTNVLPTGLRSRARQMLQEATLAAAEVEFQTQLQNQLRSKNLLKTQDLGLRNLILTATSDPKQLAREVQFSGLSTGLFTYALTQYLWEATPATTIQVSFSRVASSLLQLVGSKQQPALLIAQENKLPQTQLADIFLPDFTVGTQGVVIATEEDGKVAQLWLAGLPLQVLEYYGVNSRLTLVSLSGSTTQLVLQSRTGLTAKAQLYSPNDTTTLQVGQLVQEAVRVLPRNLNLIIALDTGLERIERVDATSAFATVSRLSSVVVGEQPADYVFGKIPAAKTNTSTVVFPSSYGLFSLGGELIPNATGEAGEAVKVAVQRLTPKLQTLMAAKLWRLTENEGSSRLGIRADLEAIDSQPPQVLMQRKTLFSQRGEQGISGGKSKRPSLTNAASILSVPIGSRIQYRVENMSDRPIYLMLLGLNSSRTALALYPWLKATNADRTSAKTTLKDVVIAPKEIRIIPQTTSGFEWVVQGPASVSETQLIFSTAPFTQTLSALEAAKQPTAELHRVQQLINPLEVAQAVMQDLHNASAVAESNATATDSYVLDVNHWASLSFVYQVV